MKTYVQIHVFLTSALVGGEWSASCSSLFTPGEKVPGTHWKGGWLGPRAGLDDLEKRKSLTLLGFELDPSCRPSRTSRCTDCTIPALNIAKMQTITNTKVGVRQMCHPIPEI
jgi:hypothetical protein